MHTIKQRKADWFSHALHRNYILQYIIVIFFYIHKKTHLTIP